MPAKEDIPKVKIDPKSGKRYVRIGKKKYILKKGVTVKDVLKMLLKKKKTTKKKTKKKTTKKKGKSTKKIEIKY